MAAAAAGLISLRGLQKSFGDVVAVDIDRLDIEAGSMVAVLGPSGCGKTTLLRLIAGLERADAGTIEIQGSDATALPPNRRPVNTVFQSYALFPHMNVYDNIAYGLKTAKIDGQRIKAACEQVLRQVELAGLERRMPGELSGGQQQRVAIARALVMRPAALLLDEPLAALDASLRTTMREHLCELQDSVGITFLLVTHEQEEAMSICQRLLFMHEGSIVQSGTPEELYSRPRNLLVARFLGRMNFIKAAVVSGCLEIPLLSEYRPPIPLPDGQATLGIRPEHIRISQSTSDSDELNLAGEIERVEFHGQLRQAVVRLADDSRLKVALGTSQPNPAARCQLSWRPRGLLVFDSNGDRIDPPSSQAGTDSDPLPSKPSDL